MAGAFGKVLVAVDGSPQSEKAFTLTLDLCKKMGAELTVVHAIPDPPTGILAEYGTKHGGMAIVKDYVESGTKFARELVGPLEKKAAQAGVRIKSEVLWEAGKSAVQLITEFAEKNDVDLIVIGTRGLGGFKRLLLGSVASGVVSHAPCSVIVVR